MKDQNKIIIKKNVFKIENEVKTFLQIEVVDENLETKITIENCSCYLSLEELESLDNYIKHQLEMIYRSKENQTQLNLF
jgi:uncharacterized protein (UPF0276 family)